MHAISRCGAGLLPGALLAIMIGSAPSAVALGETPSEARLPRACLSATQIVKLTRSLSSASGDSDSYGAAVALLLGNAPQSAQGLIAFEENRSFVYALGAVSSHLVRRLVILKPATFVIEDQTLSGSEGDTGSCLYSEGKPEITGRRVRIAAGDRHLFWETLAPRESTYQTRQQSSDEPESGKYVLQSIAHGGPSSTRSLHVLYVSSGGGQGTPLSHPKLDQEPSYWTLMVSPGNRVFRLTLPAPVDGAGEIAISSAAGKALVVKRPFPSGILPHGLEGNRLLDRWDADYRGQSPPAWDIGRPADELQRIVKEGIVRACRVVDLGCGSGTDAIFLARHGFDVTAIDISPTALSQAEEKARKAGVSVRWVLADVLTLPHLEPFDFIYDRGCYHNVRDQNLAGYIETVRRLSHPGTKFLLLSARRDEQAAADSPGVTEEELRFDFHSLFDVESLREIKLETNRTSVSPPGWSALMLRNASP
ncbi:MAG TPA: class I SAM-dependent methyltransferase [Terriglobia bacterium]|nr:class I SAM-dependent methyltransferase [Terriglobia bacterium]